MQGLNISYKVVSKDDNGLFPCMIRFFKIKFKIDNFILTAEEVHVHVHNLLHV